MTTLEKIPRATTEEHQLIYFFVVESIVDKS